MEQHRLVFQRLWELYALKGWLRRCQAEGLHGLFRYAARKCAAVVTGRGARARLAAQRRPKAALPGRGMRPVSSRHFAVPRITEQQPGEAQGLAQRAPWISRGRVGCADCTPCLARWGPTPGALPPTAYPPREGLSR